MQRSGPRRTGYIVALIIFILGSIGAGVLATLFIIGLLDLDRSLERMVAPGTEQFHLTEIGRYTVYYEYRSEVDGTEFNTPERPPDLVLTVTNLGSGEQIPVQSRSGLTTYEVGSRSGVSFQAFRVDHPGSYEVAAEYPDGSTEPSVVLAIGEGIERGILTSVGALFGSGALFCGVTLIALIVVLITYVRRSRASSTEQPHDAGYPPSIQGPD